jgi:hypothetical protein
MLQSRFLSATPSLATRNRTPMTIPFSQRWGPETTFPRSLYVHSNLLLAFVDSLLFFFRRICSTLRWTSTNSEACNVFCIQTLSSAQLQLNQ